jgi:hypothetical protein
MRIKVIPNSSNSYKINVGTEFNQISGVISLSLFLPSNPSFPNLPLSPSLPLHPIHPTAKILTMQKSLIEQGTKQKKY